MVDMSKALERVLVIDDDPQIHRLLRRALETYGYAVERADNGVEGLRLARSRTPDAVLLDLGLPDIGGQEVVERLRGFSAIPVIVLSARDSEPDKISALDAGADDYVVKPFSVGELMARIRVAMRHRRLQEGVEDIIRFDGLEVDNTRRRALANGILIPLTNKEWALLSLLARNAGRVMTHKQLLTAIWGPAQGENSQYLRVFIAGLRSKLGAAGTLIATEVGVGYRMADCL